jgi:hypothetical protein
MAREIDYRKLSIEELTKEAFKALHKSYNKRISDKQFKEVLLARNKTIIQANEYKVYRPSLIPNFLRKIILTNQINKSDKSLLNANQKLLKYRAENGTTPIPTYAFRGVEEWGIELYVPDFQALTEIESEEVGRKGYKIKDIELEGISPRLIVGTIPRVNNTNEEFPYCGFCGNIEKDPKVSVMDYSSNRKDYSCNDNECISNLALYSRKHGFDVEVKGLRNFGEGLDSWFIDGTSKQVREEMDKVLKIFISRSVGEEELTREVLLDYLGESILEEARCY